MAFREKIIWVSAAVKLIIWGSYFWDFVAACRAGGLDPAALMTGFVVTVIKLVVVQVIAEVAITIWSGREAEMPADDRERAFARAAYRPAYLTLTAGAVLLMLATPMLHRMIAAWTPAPPEGLALILVGNALLLTLVLSELVHDGAQLIRYRLGG